jgi:hypothetical protein
VAEQNRDQRPDSGSVTAGTAGGVSVPLMARRERAGCPGLGQRGRAGRGAGLVLQHLQVVLEGEDLCLLVGGRSCRATACGPSSVCTVMADSRTATRRPA